MTIYSNEDGIVVEFHGKEQLFALRAKVTVPYETITSVGFKEEFQDWCKWEVRMPGTGIPNVLLAGSYWTENGWDFLYVQNPHGFVRPLAYNVLVITTDQEKYRRVILTCEPEEAQVLMGGLKSSVVEG